MSRLANIRQKKAENIFRLLLIRKGVERQLKLPYSFNDSERKIVFNRYDLPQPWINYLSNGKMHAFVSQAGGGMAWWLSPMTFRISRYRFYNLPIDSPGFYVYIKMKDGTVWSPTFRPCGIKPDKWEAAHAPGYTTFTAEKDGLKAVLKLFMATDFNTLIWDLKLTNLKDEEVDCDVFAYTEFSQYAYQQEVILGYYLKWNVRAEYDKDVNGVMYLYSAWTQTRVDDSPVVYFSSSENVDSFCCNRDIFCGNYHDERNPAEIENGVLSNTNLLGGEPCGALHSHVKLSAHKEKSINYFLGVTPHALKNYKKAREQTIATLNALKQDGAVENQFKKNEKWWKEHFEILQCDIPDRDAMRQINTWNPLQSVHTARFSRSISSTASGIRGIGFRDTCQDMLAQAYRKPEWARDMLYYLCTQQFEDGHPVHQSWPEDKKPPQDITRSDNHIWMTYLAYAIAAETGDLSFLDKELPFLDKDMKTPVGNATLWEHLTRGVEFTENHIGQHGLPLILFSDWNDHLGPFGRKGKGESIFVSQQYIYALRQLSELAEMRKDMATVEKFAKLIEKQVTALEKYAWDGEWYLRGIDDDGRPIGTHTAKNARIWINTQSWMVIANADKRERMVKAMDSAKELLGTELGLQINAPGYPLDDDILNHKVNGLPAGYSENAGVFCQANCWAIMAEALLGRAENAWEYYLQLIPHNAIKKIGVDNYRGEAYAYCSTLLGKENEKFGTACVSQVTGTAAWMDVVSTQYLLGIRPVLNGLLIDPCIPAEWEGFTVKRKFRGCELNIEVTNPAKVQHGVKQIIFNGKNIDGTLITPELLSSCKRATVKVIMG